MIDRRTFILQAGPAAITLSLAGRSARAQTSARVVIIGAGSGGTTVATYLRRLAPGIAVTLIERNGQLTTGAFSNHVLGGLRRVDQITHGYDALKASGVSLIQGVAVDVDTARRSVALLDGTKVSYDRLILAPGVDFRFDAIEGYSPAAARVMPHGWRGADQTALLKSQLDALPDGGTVVMTIPTVPFCCPAAAYERVCMLAHALKTRKVRCKLIVLDANRTFPLQDVFKAAFRTYYADVLEYVGSTETATFDIGSVDVGGKRVTARCGISFRGGVVNLIAPQMASGIAQRAGCADAGWCPVEPETLMSTKVKDVHVIGDCAIVGDMPKSAFAANTQAKHLAVHLAQALTGRDGGPVRLRDAGWWFVTPDDCIKSGAAYPLIGRSGASPFSATDRYASQTGDDTAERRANVEEANGWYAGITADMLGTAG